MISKKILLHVFQNLSSRTFANMHSILQAAAILVGMRLFMSIHFPFVLLFFIENTQKEEISFTDQMVAVLLPLTNFPNRQNWVRSGIE